MSVKFPNHIIFSYVTQPYKARAKIKIPRSDTSLIHSLNREYKKQRVAQLYNNEKKKLLWKNRDDHAIVAVMQTCLKKNKTNKTA